VFTGVLGPKATNTLGDIIMDDGFLRKTLDDNIGVCREPGRFWVRPKPRPIRRMREDLGYFTFPNSGVKKLIHIISLTKRG
jgi:hypothetical protein